MSDDQSNNPADRTAESVQETLHLVYAGKKYSWVGGGVNASEQSIARAAQSIGQTTAIVIQDAAEMLRNINTVEITAIGAATTKWISTGDAAYQEAILNSIKIMQEAAALYLTIGTNAHEVLARFKTGE